MSGASHKAETLNSKLKSKNAKLKRKTFKFLHFSFTFCILVFKFEHRGFVRCVGSAARTRERSRVQINDRASAARWNDRIRLTDCPTQNPAERRGFELGKKRKGFRYGGTLFGALCQRGIKSPCLLQCATLLKSFLRVFRLPLHFGQLGYFLSFITERIAMIARAATQTMTIIRCMPHLLSGFI